ncbi:DDE-type integrase/transposase/recombinase [Methanobrevibacter sp. UBA417]|uniref:DDE-type integrase/transposase/recombinase n=1 Tax=Methanobrevibacter sp. UBA417 TaxID=1915487 RepID=UPI0039B84637|nr:DDE-type integrase/transposase/recombinase [Bacilli bacterium]
MNEKLLKEIALLKYSIIAPIVTNTYITPSKIEHFREESKKKYTLSNGTLFSFTPETAKGWYLKYMHHGFDALMPKGRSDCGISRTLNDEAINRIRELKNQFPHITGTLIYHKLIEDGIVKKTETSLSSVLRYIRNNNLKANQLSGIERRAFEMEFSNDMWQADSSHFVMLNQGGKKKKTYLICFIDDASRLIVGHGVFFNDNAVNMQLVFKQAVAKYGVPKRLFVDNGSPYKNEQLELICASIGTVLIHTRTYSPESKAKIERFFRTIKDKWMNGIDWNQFQSLEELNEVVGRFINDQYNNFIHSGINQTPKLRFIKDMDRFRYIPIEELDKHFLHRETRRVLNDATIPVNKITFEVPQKYIGQKIQVRYLPFDLSKAYLFDNDKAIEIYPLKKIDNSKVKRKNTIDYSKLSEVRDNV